jgi:sugar phosphate isomerase/epimerase
MDDLAVSPCSNPEMDLDDVLSAYAAAGYHKFEAFTSWTKSALDYHADPGPYLESAGRHDMAFVSVHLPPVKDDLDASLSEALCAARFAARIGAPVVLFKATTRENYIRAAAAFLDGIEGLPLTPVLQNHAGTPISTPDDFRFVLEGIDDDRMEALLEVGHFHTVGVGWREGADLLGDRIALVHVKDQVGPQSVPFGTGEIDLPGLFAHMRARGYSGDYVVEMEVEDHENTLRYLADARQYVNRHCRES